MTHETKEPQIFKIVESHIARLDSEISKLNRRADKIGCPHVSYTIHKSEMVPSPYRLKRLMERANETGSPISKVQIDKLPKVLMHDIEIIGEGPRIEGYKFVGTLDHYTLPGNVIVQAVPGETVPTQFFNSEAICDHCNKIRNRVETFVLENENDNTYLQVGRNCLRDFFGHDPMAIARFLTRVRTFVGGLDDEDEWGGRNQRSGDWYYLDKIKTLTDTIAVIRTFGWVPRSASNSEEGREATADIVLEVLFGRGEKAKQLTTKIKWDEENDLIEAKKAIKWLNEQNVDPENSYMHNLMLLNQANEIPIKMIGYWCSLISTYQRAMERLQRAKITRKLNEYFGSEGERFETTVKCVGIHFTEGMYGPITIHRMLTEQGHTLIWFANADAKMEAGNRYIIRARVKKHEEYKDWKQTQLTRASVRENLGPDLEKG